MNSNTDRANAVKAKYPNFTDAHIALLLFIAEASPLSWLDWMHSPQSTMHRADALGVLKKNGLVVVEPLGDDQRDTVIRITPAGGGLLIAHGHSSTPPPTPQLRATTVIDIITAVSQRSIQIDGDTKRSMTALRNRLGLASLEDVLTVALVMTNTLLDALPSDGVLRLVNEDGESIQTLKITP